jgi:translation initiation factor IF-2
MAARLDYGIGKNALNDCLLMTDPRKEPTPSTQPAFSGGPPRPPRRTARDLENQPDPGRVVYLLDPVVVRDLAGGIGLKPFQVIADLMELKLFKSADETIDFKIAAAVARKHGYRAERPPPGQLVL